MKVAYIFATDMAASYKLGTMILPQLERAIHGVTVVGIFFFDNNLYAIRRGDRIGERLATIAREQNIPLMICDQSALRRHLGEATLFNAAPARSRRRIP